MKKLYSYKIYLKLKPHYVDIELPSSSPDVSDKHFQYRLKVMWSATGNWWVNRNYFWNIARKFLRASQQLTRPWRLFSSQPSSQIHPQSIFSLMKKPRDFAFRPQKLFHIFFVIKNLLVSCWKLVHMWNVPHSIYPSMFNALWETQF
jgi:hypothetical protein